MLLSDNLRQEVYNVLLESRVDWMSSDIYQVVEFGCKGIADLSEQELIEAAFNELDNPTLIDKIEAELAIEDAIA